MSRRNLLFVLFANALVLIVKHDVAFCGENDVKKGFVVLRSLQKRVACVWSRGAVESRNQRTANSILFYLYVVWVSGSQFCFLCSPIRCNVNRGCNNRKGSTGRIKSTSGSDCSWKALLQVIQNTEFQFSFWFGCWRTFSILVHSLRTTNKAENLTGYPQTNCFKIPREIARQNPLLKKTCTFCALQLLWKPIILLPWHLP